ncbi:MAG: type II toxin-antitoxin system RelE/ParE family toxin [Nitrospirae bacterium]|nr:type II toxin-antitoxin system RelE/ParE family toxin [Nitrospirota bacterium]
MRIFNIKPFIRFAKSEGITDAQLFDAVVEIEKGLFEADLGGGLLKKRVARIGGGKSGGYRTLVAYREGKRAFFLHGFAKNDKENISDSELTYLKKSAKIYLALSEGEIESALKEKELKEVPYGKKKKI